MSFAETLREEDKMLLFDAQTSGGLLIALPQSHLSHFEAEMKNRQAEWWRIGQVMEPQATRLIVDR